VTPPTAGFVGLGTMGSALSAHLLAAGWRVTGYDIDPARLAAHTGRGGEAASSPAGTTVGADVVIKMYRSPGFQVRNAPVAASNDCRAGSSAPIAVAPFRLSTCVKCKTRP